MPKTNINTVLKQGASTKVHVIDYSSGEKNDDLKALKKKREAILKSKEVDLEKLSSFVIRR